MDSDPDGGLVFDRGKIALQDQRPEDAVALFQQSLSMQPGSIEREFWLGRAWLAADCPSNALEWLHHVHCIDPYYEDVRLWIGTAYNQDGLNPVNTLQWLESYSPPDSDKRHAQWLQEGIVTSQLGLYGDSACYFSSIIHEAGQDSDIGQAANRVWCQIEEAREEARTSGFFSVAQQYDSNPAVLPDVAVFGVGSPVAREDWATMLRGRLQHRIYEDGNADLVLGGSYFHTAHYDLEETDAVDMAFDATYTNRWWWGQNLIQAGATAAYDTYWFGYDPLVHRFGLTPFLSVTDEDFTTTSLVSTLRGNNFDGQAAANGTARDLDSFYFSLGLNRSHRSCDQKWTLGYGYEWQMYAAEGRDFDYDAHRLTSSLAWSPVDEWTFQLAAFVTFRPYDNVDTVFASRRDDEQYQVSFTTIRKLSESINLIATYSLDRNDSNLAPTDYERHIAELGLTFEF